MTDSRKHFLISLAYGAVIAVLAFVVSYSQRESFIFDNDSVDIFLHCLCDGLFVAAVMLLGTGVLKAIRNQGVFDVMGFGMKSVIEWTIPMLRREEKEDLQAYRERKEASRKSARSMLLAGAAYLMLSAVCLPVYYFFRR